MKRTLKILSFLLALVFAMSIFTACESNEQETKQMVTVQWVHGQKVLKEEIVENGTILTPWTPESDGKEFQGWYERPYIKKFDFEKPITKSLRIYASFKSVAGDDEPVEFVMPDWYLIGAGKGELGLSNNWNHESAAQNLGLVAGEDGIYRITLSLYAGDKFKMAQNLGWDGEVNIQAFETFANGKVTDAEGNVVFTGTEGDYWNITVAENQDGKYEISYDPNTAKLSFKLIEKLEGIPDDIRLIGDFNGWATEYVEDQYRFTSSDGTIWTYEWEVTSPSMFKLYNNISGVYYPSGVGNDLSIQAGKYTLTFNLKTEALTVVDENGQTVDVGATGSGTGSGTDTTVTPNENPVDKVYVVLNSTWNDGSKLGAWTWGAAEQWVDLTATDNANVFEVSLPAGANMIIFVDFNADATEYNWDLKREQTADLAVPDKSDDKIYYHVGSGSWTNSAEDSGSTGGSGTPSTETIKVYFQNNWKWTNVSCHYWGDGITETEWPGAAMTLVGSADGYEVYSIDLPAGTTGFLFTGNKDTEPHDLDQSPDILTEGVVNEQGFKMLWNGSNAVEGFTYDPSACVHNYVGGVCSKCGTTITYTVAGTPELCGSEWDVADTANDMEYDSEAGVFKKVYTDLTAGTHEFKIAQDHSWATSYGENGGNVVVNIATDGSTLTITFDGTTVSYNVD